MKVQTHTQVKLDRNGAQQVSWLPTKFAIVGNYVKLKVDGQVTDEWQDGWKIVEVWSTQDSKVVLERSTDHKKHRQATDI